MYVESSILSTCQESTRRFNKATQTVTWNRPKASILGTSSYFNSTIEDSDQRFEKPMTSDKSKSLSNDKQLIDIEISNDTVERIRRRRRRRTLFFASHWMPSDMCIVLSPSIPMLALLVFFVYHVFSLNRSHTWHERAYILDTSSSSTNKISDSLCTEATHSSLKSPFVYWVL
jgi:hypothetical protein